MTDAENQLPRTLWIGTGSVTLVPVRHDPWLEYKFVIEGPDKTKLDVGTVVSTRTSSVTEQFEIGRIVLMWLKRGDGSFQPETLAWRDSNLDEINLFIGEVEAMFAARESTPRRSRPPLPPGE